MSTPPEPPQARSRGLACPPRPNCVSTEGPHSANRVAPFELAIDPDAAWDLLVRAVSEMPRTKIVTALDGRLKAECRSRVLGLVDDLDLEIRGADRTVAVRSASRLGYWDLGVNRRRVEALRTRLQALGAIR